MESAPWHRLEVLLAILLMALSLVLAGRWAASMATTSLSTDEFGTVGTFSARGPLRVVTDYRAPKNHIFFNLLNSLLPGRSSLDPARVRALSILATLLTAAVVVAWSAWRRRWLEGGLLLALWSTAPQMLRASMEARGYGFLGLFAVVAAIAAVEYLRTRRRAWLWPLAAAAALGAYTLPHFLFFAGPLLAVLWLVDRTRWSFLAGAAAGLAILLLYAPVLAQLAAAFAAYGMQGASEADFRNLHGLVTATKLYFFSAGDWQAWALFAVLALAPFVPSGRPEAKGLLVVAAACIAFFASLLILRTPPLRVAAFCFLPLGIAGIWAVGGWMRQSLPRRVGMPICGVVAVFLGLKTVESLRAFDFTPAEDWLLAAHALDAAFPGDMPVDFKRRAKYLRQTLPDAAARSADYDPAAFAEGRLVVADAGNKWAEGRQFTPPANLPGIVQWIIPGTIRDIVLSFRMPAAGATADLPPALADRDLKTAALIPPAGLDLRIEPSAGARAAILLLDHAPARNELRIETAPGVREAFLAGNAVVIPLSLAKPVKVTLKTPPGRPLGALECIVLHDSEPRP